MMIADNLIMYNTMTIWTRATGNKNTDSNMVKNLAALGYSVKFTNTVSKWTNIHALPDSQQVTRAVLAAAGASAVVADDDHMASE